MDNTYFRLQAGHMERFSNSPRFQLQGWVRHDTPPGCVEVDLIDTAAYNKPLTASQLSRIITYEWFGFRFCNRYDLPEGLVYNETPIVKDMLQPGIYIVDDVPRGIYFLGSKYPRVMQNVRLLSWLQDPEHKTSPLRTQPMRIVSVTNKKLRQDFDKWMTELVRKHKLLGQLKQEPNTTLDRGEYSAFVAKLYLTGQAPHVAATELLEVTNRLWLRDYVEVGQKVWITDSITWEI